MSDLINMSMDYSIELIAVAEIALFSSVILRNQ